MMRFLRTQRKFLRPATVSGWSLKMTLLRAFNKMFPSLYVSNDIIVWDDTAEEAKWKPWTSRFGVAMVKSKMKEKEDGGTGAEKKG